MFFSIIVSEDTLKPQENTGYLEFEGLEINCMTKQQGNTVDSLNGKNSFMDMQKITYVFRPVTHFTEVLEGGGGGCSFTYSRNAQGKIYKMLIQN